MIAAVLLAAGSARRFDGPQKLLALVRRAEEEVPLVRLAALGLTEAGLERIVAVVGREGEQVRRALEGIAMEFAVNANYASGLSSSLRVGVSAAMHRWPDSEALLIALGDQPLVGAGIVRMLVQTFEQRAHGAVAAIVAPRFNGEIGTPVLFAPALVTELMEVTGDRGARSVVERDPGRVRYVEFNRDAPPDVDTVSDLAALSRELRTR